MKTKEKGITLIALVITIIVLLILAGITINSIMSTDSAPQKAGEAKEETYKAKVRDDVSLTMMDSISSNTGKLDEDLLENNIRKISGFTGEITKETVDNKTEFSFTVDGYQVKIDKNRNISINGKYAGNSSNSGGNSGENSGGGNTGGSNSGEVEQTVVSNEMVYDRGTFGEGWNFYTDQDFGNDKPQINADNYNLGAGTSYKLLYTQTIDLEKYTKAYFVVDDVNTLSRISISEAPEKVNHENVYDYCTNSNTTITQQEDGLYLIEWNISSLTCNGKIAMSAWHSEGSRKLYKMYLEKTVIPKTKTMIYNYGTTSNGFTLSTEHDYSGKGQVIANEDNYQLKPGSNYSILYTNDIDFSNYDYFCTEIDNVNTLDRISLRKDPFEVNHGQYNLLVCSDAKSQGKVYIEKLENGRYFMRVDIKNVTGTGSINYNAWNGSGDRKVYKIWLEKEK